MSPIESTSQTPGAGRVVADPRRVAGQGEDVADAQGVGAEQLRLERHQVPVAGREVDEALEVEIVLDAERDGEAAHPDAGHRRVADVDEVDARPRRGGGRPRSSARSGSSAAGRSRPRRRTGRSARAPSPAGSAAAPRRPSDRAPPDDRSSSRRPSAPCGGAGGRGRARGPGAPALAGAIASSAARIAATWSGVVPQQPPTIDAPAPSIRGDDRRRSSRARRRRRTGPRPAAGSPALGMIDRSGVAGSRAGHPLERLEAAERPGAAVDADRVDIGLGERAARPPRASCRRPPRAPRRTSSRPRSAGRRPRRASSMASRRWTRSENVSSTNRSTPPSSRPSICSRNAARIAALVVAGQVAGRAAERTDRAGDEDVAARRRRAPHGRAGRARRLNRAASPASPKPPAARGSPRTWRSR